MIQVKHSRKRHVSFSVPEHMDIISKLPIM